MELLRRKPPPPPAKTATIKVPAAAVLNPRRTLGFATASGAKEEVRLPPSVQAGDTIEV